MLNILKLLLVIISIFSLELATAQEKVAAKLVINSTAPPTLLFGTYEGKSADGGENHGDFVYKYHKNPNDPEENKDKVGLCIFINRNNQISGPEKCPRNLKR